MAQIRDCKQEVWKISQIVFGEVEASETRTRPLVQVLLTVVGLLKVGESGNLIGRHVQDLQATELEDLLGEAGEAVATEVDGGQIVAEISRLNFLALQKLATENCTGDPHRVDLGQLQAAPLSNARFNFPRRLLVDFQSIIQPHQATQQRLDEAAVLG